MIIDYDLLKEHAPAQTMVALSVSEHTDGMGRTHCYIRPKDTKQFIAAVRAFLEYAEDEEGFDVIDDGLQLTIGLADCKTPLFEDALEHHDLRPADIMVEVPLAGHLYDEETGDVKLYTFSAHISVSKHGEVISSYRRTEAPRPDAVDATETISSFSWLRND